MNKLEFNEDGTIKPVKLDLDGVGALRRVKGKKKLDIDSVYASSVSLPLAIKPIKDTLCRRTEYFVPDFVIDGSNGSRWMADPADTDAWIVADLGRKRKIRQSEIFFVRPTAGHAYCLEGSVDGEHWQVCGGHDDLRVCSPHTDSVNQKFRFLRIRFKEGIQGIWEWNLY